jgi:hypothetical protein
MKPRFTVFPLDHSPGFLVFETAAKIPDGLSLAFQTAGFTVTPINGIREHVVRNLPTPPDCLEGRTE